MRHRKPINSTLYAIAIAATLAGCSANFPAGQNQGPNSGQPAQTAQANGQIPNAPANDPDAQASTLLAAAEPFENLTENAFTSDTAKLDLLIAEVRSSGNGASRLLPPGEAAALADHVAAIDAARAGDDRADLAIAAVEGYRTLVINSGDQQMVPKQVSLLDYSGFRYQADLKATPVRWPDAGRAVDFADAQWHRISASVTDNSLRTNMAEALAGMRTALQNKDAGVAMTASTRELDLVDGLEQYFANN